MQPLKSPWSSHTKILTLAALCATPCQPLHVHILESSPASLSKVQHHDAAMSRCHDVAMPTTASWKTQVFQRHASASLANAASMAAGIPAVLADEQCFPFLGCTKHWSGKVVCCHFLCCVFMQWSLQDLCCKGWAG